MVHHINLFGLPVQTPKPKALHKAIAATIGTVVSVPEPETRNGRVKMERRLELLRSIRFPP